jgi:hypothetical protein
MIPDILRKQNRALELETASLNRDLSPAESAELQKLRSIFEKDTRRAIRSNFAQCRRVEAHQKKTKDLHIGQYAAAA